LHTYPDPAFHNNHIALAIRLPYPNPQSRKNIISPTDKTALDKEQMPWPRYVANDDYLKKVEQYFTIPSIPTAFICTEDGKVIREFRDYPNDMVSVVDSIFGQ
jgi:hypothetical protein